MKHIAGRILIAVVGLALLGWILGYFAYGGGQSSEEARTQFVTELRQFEAFETHQALLLDTVERAHEEVFQSNQRKQKGHSSLMWDGYRVRMYRELGEALREAEHADVAIQLDRHRARTG
ncbi:MAG: hypothetical protein ACYTGF_17490 [Planctomycetota bacterium]|jgi:hypothetical protein